MPSPYESARPRATVALPSTCSRKSATSRDLPIPAGPISVNRRLLLVATTSSKSGGAARARARGRPSGARGGVRHRPRWRRGGAAGAPSPGPLFPFNVSSSGSVVTASRTRRKLSSPSRISPAPAACSSRAATLTASPVTSVSPSPATTAPVLTPIRASSPSSCTTSRNSTAARVARSASSSVATGIPNTAITASPTNFSTLPPCRSSTPRAVS